MKHTTSLFFIKDWCVANLHFFQSFHPVHKTMANPPNAFILKHDKYKVLDYGTKCFRDEPRESELKAGVSRLRRHLLVCLSSDLKPFFL